MPGLLPNVDPDGLLEFSVVYTDRSLNHMSKAFMGVINDISGILKEVYNARSAIVVPGSGTYGMEAVARQFATNNKCLVIRNGWFTGVHDAQVGRPVWLISVEDLVKIVEGQKGQTA